MLDSTEKLIKQLRKDDLPLADRVALTAVLLDKVNALPLQDVIVLVPGSAQVNGKVLDPEQLISLKESCISLADNFARKLIHEQVRWLAINEGVHKALNTEQIIFSKAALWVLERENKVIEEIVTHGTGFSSGNQA